jgi:hypothetical protein
MNPPMGIHGPAWCRICRHEWHQYLEYEEVCDVPERERWHIELECPHCEHRGGQFGSPTDSGIEGWDLSLT